MDLDCWNSLMGKSAALQESVLHPASVPAEITATTWLAAQSRSGRVVKRAGDILFAASALAIGLPLLLLIAFFVKMTSNGSVLYSQRRIGRGYRGFGCLKFRTMRKGADKMLERILASDVSLREEYERDFKLKSDPRITPLGNFLRRTSLDELPQLINVLKGQMSVVGPRPIVWDELERYGRCMDQVLSVRPGLTGLWQVSGRNNLPYETRVKLDLYYVSNRTFWLDVRIILRTIGVVLLPMDRGAY
jgi:lipopolysaccharide/colanic/teichoic acid biosynthesis glycosyltransferase